MTQQHRHTLELKGYNELHDDHPDERLDPPEEKDGWYVVAIRWQGAIPAPRRTS